MAQHKGRIDVRSEGGKGSVFTLRLSRATAFGAWPRRAFGPLNPAILPEIERDTGQQAGVLDLSQSTEAVGWFWWTPVPTASGPPPTRSGEHTAELQSHLDL